MSSDFCIKCDNALAVYCGKCVDAEREELNRLRRLVPTGTYTLNVAHEEELARMRETLKKLTEAFDASEADCERFVKLLDDCRDELMGQYDPDSVNAMIHRIDDAIGPCDFSTQENPTP